MPNWCENSLIIRGEPKRIAELVRKILNEKGEIDFERIVPSPKTIEECPEKYIIKENRRITPDEDRPWFDWYEWQCDNWGTKWNADCFDSFNETAEEIEKQGLEYVSLFFNTAWSPAEPIAERLIQDNPDLYIELDYFEWGMWFAGYVSSDGNHNCVGDREIEQLAIDIFNYDESDFGNDDEEEEEEDEFADDEF